MNMQELWNTKHSSIRQCKANTRVIHHTESIKKSQDSHGPFVSSPYEEMETEKRQPLKIDSLCFCKLMDPKTPKRFVHFFGFTGSFSPEHPWSSRDRIITIHTVQSRIGHRFPLWFPIKQAESLFLGSRPNMNNKKHKIHLDQCRESGKSGTGFWAAAGETEPKKNVRSREESTRIQPTLIDNFFNWILVVSMSRRRRRWRILGPRQWWWTEFNLNNSTCRLKGRGRVERIQSRIQALLGTMFQVFFYPFPAFQARPPESICNCRGRKREGRRKDSWSFHLNANHRKTGRQANERASWNASSSENPISKQPTKNVKQSSLRILG